jgi:hypothetical protein
MAVPTLGESVGAALDAALFGSTAADATRAAGLLAGVSPITPVLPRRQASRRGSGGGGDRK